MRAIALAAVAALALAGCTSGTEEASDAEPSTTAVAVDAAPSETAETAELDRSLIRGAPSEGCRAAMETAEAALEQHYAIFDTSRGLVDADAEEADFKAIMLPLYGACEGPHDLMAGFKAYPYVAGVTGPQFVDGLWLQVFCGFGESSSQACTGYEEAVPLYTQP